MRRALRIVALAVALVALVGAGSVAGGRASSSGARASTAASSAGSTTAPRAGSTAAPRALASATTAPSATSSPASALVTIPAAGVHGLRTVLYPGAPDDVRGTGFEERGLAAVPTGPGGGVRPGQVGNLIVTAHRTAAGGPFRQVPGLRDGDHILMTWAGHTYDYVVVDRFWVTFHDPASYALQVASVPGHPGATATKAMVTLSTCATPEDNALGLRQRDALGNPPHRIDVIGLLVAVH